MVEPMLIDLKALLVEREDCDAGTVQKLREAWPRAAPSTAPSATSPRRSRRSSKAPPAPPPRSWHLKLGIAQFFLGYTADAADNLQQAEGALAGFYLGRALVSLHDYDEALKAFDKAEKPATPPARCSSSAPASTARRAT